MLSPQCQLCINGNEYRKCQLARRGVAFGPLDNGVKSCADTKLMQRLCDFLSAAKIDRLLRKWLRRLPHPFPPRESRRRLSLPALHPAGRVLAHPGARPAGDGARFLRGGDPRELDFGCPSQVSLVFDRKMSRRTPGSSAPVSSPTAFAARRAIPQGGTRDFAIGRRIDNLDELRKIGFAANRRLLDVQRIG
jgi:hypothetical protein